MQTLDGVARRLSLCAHDERVDRSSDTRLIAVVFQVQSAHKLWYTSGAGHIDLVTGGRARVASILGDRELCYPLALSLMPRFCERSSIAEHETDIGRGLGLPQVMGNEGANRADPKLVSAMRIVHPAHRTQQSNRQLTTWNRIVCLFSSSTAPAACVAGYALSSARYRMMSSDHLEHLISIFTSC